MTDAQRQSLLTMLGMMLEGQAYLLLVAEKVEGGRMLQVVSNLQGPEGAKHILAEGMKLVSDDRIATQRMQPKKQKPENN